MISQKKAISILTRKLKEMVKKEKWNEDEIEFGVDKEGQNGYIWDFSYGGYDYKMFVSYETEKVTLSQSKK